MHGDRGSEQDQPGPSRWGAWARHDPWQRGGTLNDEPGPGDEDETMDDQWGMDADNGGSRGQDDAAGTSGEQNNKHKDGSDAKKDGEA